MNKAQLQRIDPEMTNILNAISLELGVNRRVASKILARKIKLKKTDIKKNKEMVIDFNFEI